VITPERVAELLMLHPDMPRSLLACMDDVMFQLSEIRNDVSADTERFAGRLHAQLKFSRIEEILDSGLHTTLTEFLETFLNWATASAAIFWFLWPEPAVCSDL
jgi:uncharacterized alpha-E superfamily protein